MKHEPGISYAENYAELRRLASTVPADQAIVELGTFRGASAEVLGFGAWEGLGAHVWTIDPHDLEGYRTTTGVGKARRPIDFTDPEHRLTAHARLSDAGLLGTHVTMIRDFSTAAAVNWPSYRSVGMLYIDGDHREGAARRDFAAWEPHLASGALVVFDDYREDRFPGVVHIVEALIAKDILALVEFVGGMAITRRIR